MPLYKIVKLWFIPPGVYVTLFMLLALFLAICTYNSRHYSRGLFASLMASSLVCVLLAGASYAVSCNAGAQRLMHSLEYKYSQTDIQPDAIIVLASGMDRINTGVELFKKYPVDIIVSGYNGSADNMKQTMIKKDVPMDKIVVEPEATNTKDHVTYILPIAKEKGYKKVYLVTTAYHMPRSMLNLEGPFREAGIIVVPYPCGYTVPKKHQYTPTEWLPNLQSFAMGTRAWHEYLGMLNVWLGLPDF